MSEELKDFYYSATSLKQVLLEDNAVDVLLFLAKYNPKTTCDQIVGIFGKGVIKTIDKFKKFDLIQSEEDKIFLTKEGLFQVDSLLSLKA